MSIETDSIQGVLIKNQTVILNPDIQHGLEQKGYGEMEKNKLLLKPFESLYLLYTNKLIIFKGKNKMDLIYFYKFVKSKMMIF